MRSAKSIEALRETFLSGIGVPEEMPFVADEFQLRAIQSLLEGKDTLVVAPTGSGKTYIALEAIHATLLTKGRAIYTTPLKALSNTKYTDFKKRFEPEYRVGLLTGDRKIEGDAGLVVATTEIFRNELYHYSERYALVVLDEVHFIADEQRGAVWEESIILAPRSSTLLMLSASISNAQEIADWLEAVRGKPCTVISEKKRPVDLRLGFIHPELGVIPLFDQNKEILREVVQCYGGRALDPQGLRLNGDEGPRRRGSRSFDRRGSGGRKSGRGGARRKR